MRWMAVTLAITGGAMGAALFSAFGGWCAMAQWVGFWVGASSGVMYSVLSNTDLARHLTRSLRFSL